METGSDFNLVIIFKIDNRKSLSNSIILAKNQIITYLWIRCVEFQGKRKGYENKPA